MLSVLLSLFVPPLLAQLSERKKNLFAFSGLVFEGDKVSRTVGPY